MHEELVRRIRNRTARICVVGLGYVGLPTAMYFAEAGFPVTGCDVKEQIVDHVRNGRSHLSDLGIDKRLRNVVKKGKFKATTDTAKAVGGCDIVLITVPTPTGKGFEPDLQYVVSAGEAAAKGLHRGHLMILESTVYPGVTEDILKPLLEKSGLKAGRDFGLAYCPERYNPGDSKHTIDKVVRVVGAVDRNWARTTAELYDQITKTMIVENIRTAEMAKIIENTQRDLNIALMNEVALICERMGIDVMGVIDAAATKWNFNVYYPGAGVGGHCLPKDPWYLVKAAERLGYHAQVVTAGRRVNDSMPHHVFELLVRALNDSGRSMKGSRIVILGLSYKENIGDIRNSPALGLIHEIKRMGGVVYTVDPYVLKRTAADEFPTDRHFDGLASVPKVVDALVLITPHEVISERDILEFAKKMRTPIIIDGRRRIDKRKARQLGLIYKGIGDP